MSLCWIWLTFSLTSNKFYYWMHFLKWYCLVVFQNFPSQVFFKLLTLFRCLLYFCTSESFLDFRAHLRNLPRFRISFLSSDINHGLSFSRIIISFVGIHWLAIWRNFDVNILHISSKSSKSESNAFQSIESNNTENFSLSVLSYNQTSLLNEKWKQN